MPKKRKRLNPVAKFAQQYQRCATFIDRKKRYQQGYRKHKKAEVLILPPFFYPAFFQQSCCRSRLAA